MHDTMMTALQNESNSMRLQSPRELTLQKEMHARDIAQVREEATRDLREARTKLAEKENSVKDVLLQMESMEIEHQRKSQVLELDKKELEN